MALQMHAYKTAPTYTVYWVRLGMDSWLGYSRLQAQEKHVVSVQDAQYTCRCLGCAFEGGCVVVGSDTAA